MILKIKGTSGGTWHLFDNVERFSYDTNRKEKYNDVNVPDEFFNIQNGNDFDEELEVLGDSTLPSNEHSNSNFYQIATFQRKAKNYLIVFDTFAYLMGDDGETIERIGSKKTNQSGFGISGKKKRSKGVDSTGGVTISNIKETLRSAKPSVTGKSKDHEDLDPEAEVARNKFLAGIAETFNEAKETSFDPLKEIRNMAEWIESQKDVDLEEGISPNFKRYEDLEQEEREMADLYHKTTANREKPNIEVPPYENSSEEDEPTKPEPPKDTIITEGGEIPSSGS